MDGLVTVTVKVSYLTGITCCTYIVGSQIAKLRPVLHVLSSEQASFALMLNPCKCRLLLSSDSLVINGTCIVNGKQRRLFGVWFCLGVVSCLAPETTAWTVWEQWTFLSSRSIMLEVDMFKINCLLKAPQVVLSIWLWSYMYSWLRKSLHGLLLSFSLLKVQSFMSHSDRLGGNENVETNRRYVVFEWICNFHSDEKLSWDCEAVAMSWATQTDSEPRGASLVWVFVLTVEVFVCGSRVLCRYLGGLCPSKLITEVSGFRVSSKYLC